MPGPRKPMSKRELADFIQDNSAQDGQGLVSFGPMKTPTTRGFFCTQNMTLTGFRLKFTEPTDANFVTVVLRKNGTVITDQLNTGAQYNNADGRNVSITLVPDDLIELQLTSRNASQTISGRAYASFDFSA